MIDREIIDKHIKNLGSSNPGYWPKARYELVKLGYEVTDDLIKRLKHKNPVMRGRIARVLGEIGDTKAVPGLIDLLEEETDNYVVSSTVHALGELGDESAVEILIDKLVAKEPKIRKEAARALGEIGDSKALKPLEQYYELSSDEERVWAACALASLGKEELLYILEDNLKEEVLLSAIKVSGNLNLKETAPLLLELLKVTDSLNMKIEIIKALAHIGGEEVIKDLNKYYKKCRGEERIWVIYALSKLGDKSKETMVVDVLKKSVRKATALAIGEIGKSTSSEVLIKALKSNEKEVRYSVVQALQKLCNENIIKYLKETLEEEKESHIRLLIEEIIM